MTFIPRLPAATLARPGHDFPPATTLDTPTPEATQAAAEARYDTIRVELDSGNGIFWCRLNPQGRPCFSPELLRDVTAMHRSIERMFQGVRSAAEAPFRYFVCGSAIPGIFNLGGDLNLFHKLIGAGDLDGLRRYGRAAVAAIHRNHTGFDLPVITIALVQGDALGGGFECALSHDMIVAERSAKFGLPEVLFNLFPGMGAHSFLVRRIGQREADRMITSGKIYTAEELHEMGIVDVLAPDGEGEAALLDYIEKNNRRHNALQGHLRARRRVNPVTLEELQEIVDLWAETAIRLTEQDLRLMARLVAAQDRRRAAPGRERATAAA
jgi:DSF synthase